MNLKIDLHVHTKHSPCALLKPKEIEKIALKQGLNGIAITDHNTLRGAHEVLSFKKFIKVIIGEEIETNQGEIIGYFLTDEIPPFLSLSETITEIRKQGGLVSIPHPFDRLRSSRIRRKALEEILHEVDMIEVFNSRDIFPMKEEQLFEKVVKSGAVPIVSSDAHLRTEVGRSYVIIESFTTPKEFLRNMKKAQKVSRKSPLWVHIATKLIKLSPQKKTGT